MVSLAPGRDDFHLVQRRKAATANSEVRAPARKATGIGGWGGGGGGGGRKRPIGVRSHGGTSTGASSIPGTRSSSSSTRSGRRKRTRIGRRLCRIRQRIT